MYEIDFLPVGTSNGDAICIHHGNDQTGYYLHIVDGGFKDSAETIIRHIETYYGRHYFINHMVVSHADNDHAAGLIGVIDRFDVKVLWMNRPWLFADQILKHFHGNYTLKGLIDSIRERHSYLVELEELAKKRGTIIRDVFQGDQIGPFTVLAPSRERYIELLPDLDKTPTSYREATVQRRFFADLIEKVKRYADENWDIETLSNNPEPTSASNETCVVQYGIIEESRLLLTADAGPAALNEAANYGQARGLWLPPPHFVQVPHHGSRRNVTPAVLDRLLGPKMQRGQVYGTAYCSVGSDQQDYPRGQVKNAFARRGYPVYATRDGTRTYFKGRELRAGWVVPTPEPFANRVEL